MANESGSIDVDSKKDQIQAALENAQDLTKRSTEELKSFFDEYKNGDDFLATAALATELASRPTEKPNGTKEIAKDALKQEEANRVFQENLTAQTQAQNTQNKDKIEELTAQLNDSNEKIGSLEEKIEQLLEENKKNRGETTKSLDDILDAKKSGDSEALKKAKLEIENLNQQKNDLEIKYKKEELKYPEGEIRTLRTRRIGGGITKFGTVEVKKGRKFEIKAESLKRVKNLRSRRNINKTIKKFNEIGTDSKEAVKYIMSKTNKSSGGKITASFKKLYYHLTIRDKDKFDDVFNKQKKKFIDDLFGNFGNNATERDKKIKESIVRRLDYHQKAYKEKMITV